MSGQGGKRRRVLVIAEAANPEWVSVPLVGWSLARALGRVAEVHVVTQVRNREAFLRAGLTEGRDFTAVDSERLARPLWALGEWLRMGEGRGWTALQLVNALSYPHFERLVWRAFGPRIRAGEFDIVHRVTPLSPTISSPLAPKVAAAGVPFVLGPLNGGVPWPAGFEAERRREREFLSYLRGAYKALPGRRRTLEAASAVLVGSRHTLGEMPADLRARCAWLPENAVDPARFPPSARRPETGPLRAAFLGRMVPYKGPDMLLEAAAPLLRDGRMALDMLGDGPLLPELRAQAERLQVGHAVTFHGWVDHARVHERLGAAHLLSFPSIREFGGGVVLEAMALGVAPLIVDYAGPAELVTGATGYRIPLSDRAGLVEALGAELARLSQDLPGILATGDRARERVARHFTWARKADQVARIYEAVLAGAERMPDLFDEPAATPDTPGPRIARAHG